VSNIAENYLKAFQQQTNNLFDDNGKSTYAPIGLAMRFTVSVGGLNLGAWSACKGLKADFKPQRFREQGNPMFEKVLYGEISYPPIVLERAMRADQSAAVQTWLTAQLRSWMTDPSGYKPSNATIVLLDNAGKEVVTWTLRRVYPSAWTGPTLNSMQSAVAIESLELVHEGFL
jgi:phage tail-like protein